MFEAAELDRIPLPSARADLFELLCLVRIARVVAPPLPGLRWIDRNATDNTVRWRQITCEYQHSLRREDLLASPEYGGSLARALEEFDVAVPKRFDLVFEFATPLNGFDGIIVEAKSGDQEYGATVQQLRAYRAALARSARRYVVWGIVERSGHPARADRVKQLCGRCAAHQDLWIFSTAEDIPSVLEVIFPVSSDLGVMTRKVAHPAALIAGA